MQKVRLYTSEVGGTYRSTLRSLQHGVGNNPLQAQSVSHDGYLAIWYGVSVNRTNEGYCACWGGVQKGMTVANVKRREEKETMTTFYTQQSGFGLRTCLAFVYIN